jgi:hypothetical protein
MQLLNYAKNSENRNGYIKFYKVSQNLWEFFKYLKKNCRLNNFLLLQLFKYKVLFFYE